MTDAPVTLRPHPDRLLARCPFCRSNPVAMMRDDGDGTPAYYARCGACGATGPRCEREMRAAARWNLATPEQGGP